MATYTNISNNVGPGGSVFTVLYQKTDWQVSDFTSGSYFIGAGGVITAGAPTGAPWDFTGFRQVQLTFYFDAMTGTSPSLIFNVKMYDDKAGTAPHEQLAVGGNFATGAQNYLTFGAPASTTVGNYTGHPAMPLWCRINLYTAGGTISGIGTNNRISIIGVR